MKSFIYPLIIIFTISLNAQVGIGTTSPNAALDVTSTTDGFLIPRVALTDLTTLTVLTPTASEIIYNTTSNGTVEPGFYYLSTATGPWIRFGGSGWLLDGNPSVAAANFMGSINDADVAFRRFNSSAGRIGDSNTAFGLGATNTNVGIQNTAFGVNTLLLKTGGSANTAIGWGALSGTGTYDNAIALGFQAGSANSASNTTLLGFQAGQNNSGDRFIAIGFQAGTNNTAINNIAIGSNALDNHIRNASGQNIAIGTNAMGDGSNNSTTVSDNIAIGNQAGQSITSINNVAIGSSAGLAMGGGQSNVAIGSSSMVQAGGTSFNVAIGTEALFNYSGGSNVSIGYRANQFNGSGFNSVAIGYEANTANLENAIAIGYQVTAPANNSIRLGNAAITQVITSGVMSAFSFLATGSGTPYADYVFEDYYNGMSKIKSNYKFNTLESTEAFVIKNGHLPGVKSYAEVMENGFKLDLTDATITNLEKLEEQFLYITELNKKISTQENTIQTQNEKIKTLETRLERIEMLLKE